MILIFIKAFIIENGSEKKKKWDNALINQIVCTKYTKYQEGNLIITDFNFY